MQRQSEGSTLVFMFSQWDELDSMEAYANIPMLLDFVKDVSTYLSPVNLEIYEVLG